MSTVAIFGPGLIGGSLALALRLRRPHDTVRVWTRSEPGAARARKFLPDVTCDAAAAARGADVCVFCTPVGAMADLARTIAPHLDSGAVVTDAGSVKGHVVRELAEIFGRRFVGAHPMAGSEQAGIEAAGAGLFEGAVCILTPTGHESDAAIATVRRLWSDVGCRLVEMSATDHDRAVARVSHLPHAVAAALVAAIGEGDLLSVAGAGYRDTTRVAAGPPAMWSEILLENRAEVEAGLADLSEMIETLQSCLRRGDAAALEKFLADAQRTRRTVR